MIDSSNSPINRIYFSIHPKKHPCFAYRIQKLHKQKNYETFFAVIVIFFSVGKMYTVNEKYNNKERMILWNIPTSCPSSATL